jgi:D-alanyl-lipoteichoic acid acyltransferase DltB (MBOAT superfamily)
MSFTIVVDYNIGRKIHEQTEEKKRKRLLFLSIFANLLVLCFFKYFNFFLQSTERVLSGIGLSVDMPLLNIILPVGISFYTFQSMSYVVDIYRRQIKPTDNIVHYATYVSFFPQLVAGPIERASRLLPQLVSKRKPTYEQITEGCYLIYWGLFKKLFIADNLARIVDPIYNAPDPSSTQIIVGTYAFAFQIYCDFSAYSDIARGLAKTMGVDLMLNFNLPYTAKNPAEFWKRWHISLSTWLRDYLYKPLGGNRSGKLNTARNLMVTMLLGGLWHGANTNFVIWGAFQGCLLVIHRAYRVFADSYLTKLVPDTYKATASKLNRFISWFVFFHLMCIGWLLFRATSEAQISYMLFTLLEGIEIGEFIRMLPKLVFYISPLLLMQYFQYKHNDLNILLSMPMPIRMGAYIAMFYLMVSSGALDSGEFIYFQF